jgi:hypothetical protein
VKEEAPNGNEEVRAAEVIAACCLATDLGMGFPFEHGLHATLMAQRLAGLLGVDAETMSQTYYCCLLTYTGCTTDADISIAIFGGNRTENITPVQFGSTAQMLGGIVRAVQPPGLPPYRRAYEIARRLPKAARFLTGGPHFEALCDVAEMMAQRLGLPPSIYRLLAYLTERWDGKGILGRATGDEIPLPLRINSVARDAAYHRLLAGDEHAVEVIQERAGKAFDPDIANAFAVQAAEVMAAADAPESAWEATLAVEPKPWLTLQEKEIDQALAAMGDFADLLSPFHSGHSAGVAKLVASAAERCRFDRADVERVRRAAHLHDLGTGCRVLACLAETGAALGQRTGGGQAAPLPHRTDPFSFPVPHLLGRDRLQPPRTARWEWLPPRSLGGLSVPARPTPRRCRRISCDDGAETPSRPSVGGAGC